MIRWPEGFTRESRGGDCVAIAVAIAAGHKNELEVKRRLIAKRIMGRRGGVYGFLWHLPEITHLAGLRRVRIVVTPRRVLSDTYFSNSSGAPVVQRLERGVTIATFAKLYDRGTWLLSVARHAVALVDGQLLGYYNPRARFEWALEVTKERGHRASVSE